MEEKNYAVEENENIGSVKIADDVVSMIAAFAAAEVDGVSSLAADMKGEIMHMVGLKNPSAGVKVELMDKNVKADIAIVVEYGFNIPAVSRQVQAKVKSAVENMTGLKVTDVNVRIAGVNMKSK